ncbi:hypothetical protein BJF88_16205 [Cellulosimicrobium sp. CUA-896]|nr:hypothetical protein BJF88_16205 [Cellulosimicrobium sp. CUA-896]
MLLAERDEGPGGVVDVRVPEPQRLADDEDLVVLVGATAGALASASPVAASGRVTSPAVALRIVLPLNKSMPASPRLADES